MTTMTRQVLEKFTKWKEGKDDGYIYDEIHNFVFGLRRGDLLDCFNDLEQLIAEAEKEGE